MNDDVKLEKLRIRLQAIAKGKETIGDHPMLEQVEEGGVMKLARELLVEYFGYDERSHKDWMRGA